jgi:hypothetical protein
VQKSYKAPASKPQKKECSNDEPDAHVAARGFAFDWLQLSSPALSANGSLSRFKKSTRDDRDMSKMPTE